MSGNQRVVRILYSDKSKNTRRTISAVNIFTMVEENFEFRHSEMVQNEGFQRVLHKIPGIGTARAVIWI